MDTVRTALVPTSYPKWLPDVVKDLLRAATTNCPWSAGEHMVLSRKLVEAFIEVSLDDQAAHTVGYNSGPPVVHGNLLALLPTRTTLYRQLVNCQSATPIRILHLNDSAEFKSTVPIGATVLVELRVEESKVRRTLAFITIGWRVRHNDNVVAIGRKSILLHCGKTQSD